MSHSAERRAHLVDSLFSHATRNLRLHASSTTSEHYQEHHTGRRRNDWQPGFSPVIFQRSRRSRGRWWERGHSSFRRDRESAAAAHQLAQRRKRRKQTWTSFTCSPTTARGEIHCVYTTSIREEGVCGSSAGECRVKYRWAAWMVS